jgi:hypothetical protein
MARKSGDVTLSTFRRILAAMVLNGHDRDSAMEFLFGLNDAEDGDSFDTLVKLCDKQDKERAGIVPGKPGRKSEIDEYAIAVEVCSRVVIRGERMTPEKVAELPDGNPLKVRFGQLIADAVKKARAENRAKKAEAEIATLAAKYARGEIDSMDAEENAAE